MIKQFLKWLRKIASDLHNVLISLIVGGIIATHHFGTTVQNTKNVLKLNIELWIVIILCLSVLLCCLLIFRIYSYFHNLLIFDSSKNVYVNKRTDKYFCPFCLHKNKKVQLSVTPRLNIYRCSFYKEKYNTDIKIIENKQNKQNKITSRESSPYFKNLNGRLHL